MGSRTTEYDMPELWMSDGTAAGTVKNTSVSRAISVVSFGNKEFMSAFAGDDYELWTSEGTTLSTTLFKDFRIGHFGMPYYGMVGNENKALFLGRDEIHGHEPWVTNGTAAGTFW